MADRHAKSVFGFSEKVLAPESASEVDVYKLQCLLARYGYLDRPYVPGRYDSATEHAVEQFQSFYSLYPTAPGEADEETVTLLTTPRCGNRDPEPGYRTASGRLAPFVAVGAWSKLHLTYRYLNATPDLSTSRQQEIINEAFARWSNVSALTFEEVDVSQPSDLAVAFHHGSHGDGEPFDDGGGPDGNTLAHAFFPPPHGGQWAGSLHFDEFEGWKDAPGGAGTRLYNVALHEIGHLLGLSHSQDQNAIMYAYYAEDRNDLRADDIAGIQSLYAAAQADPVVVSAGVPVSGHLPQTDAEAAYQITLHDKLMIKLDGPPDQDFDVYVRYGEPAGMQPGQYDARGYGATADELVTIENPQQGTYYLLVHSYNGSGSYTMEVELT